MNIVRQMQDGTYGLFLRVFAVSPRVMAKACFILAISWYITSRYFDYSYGRTYGFADFYSVFCFLTYGLAVVGWVLHLIFYSRADGAERVSYMPNESYGRFTATNLFAPVVAVAALKMFISANGMSYLSRGSYLYIIGCGLAVTYFLLCTFRMGLGIASIATVRHGVQPIQVSPARDNVQSTEDDDALTVKVPSIDFESVFGMHEVKERIYRAGTDIIKNRDPKTERNGILLYGGPGNGKTLIAEALAGEMKVKFCVIEYGRTSGQWVGLTTARLRKAFDRVRKIGPCVLFIDEIDSFIKSGNGMQWRNEENEQIVNFFLTELVSIRGLGIVVMGATNKIEQLDSRATREGRFDFKIEIPPPDAKARYDILRASLSLNVPNIPVADHELRFATDRWTGFNVKRLQAVGEELSEITRNFSIRHIGYRELLQSLRRVQGKEGYKMPAAKRFDELIFQAQTSEALKMISSRISDPYKFESQGGTIPSGILFSGPPGTGKTATSIALAVESGWHFFSVSGPDLLKDISKIESIYEAAKSFRPSIIFLDEADEVLKDRRFNQNSAVADKLLTIMDGASERHKDVIIIAATNNPDIIDSAFLRAGRFTEKVPFFAADYFMAEAIISDWLSRKNITFNQGLTILEASRMMEGYSPANIEGTLQYALNFAIANSEGGGVKITRDQLQSAISIVI